MAGALYEMWEDPTLLQGPDGYFPVALALFNTFAMVYILWRERVRPWLRKQPGAGTTSLAVLIAGRRRDLRSAWFADLAGAPEAGIRLTQSQKRRLAFGFLAAAVVMRMRDMGAPLWRPVDWLLASDSRTRTVTVVVVGAQVIYIQATAGLQMLLTEGWAWCGACGVAVSALFKWLRHVRGIHPRPAPQPPE
ncbi:hypothetical protein ACOZE4_18360 [Streptomyces griseoincarnatus]